MFWAPKIQSVFLTTALSTVKITHLHTAKYQQRSKRSKINIFFKHSLNTNEWRVSKWRVSDADHAWGLESEHNICCRQLRKLRFPHSLYQICIQVTVNTRSRYVTLALISRLVVCRASRCSSGFVNASHTTFHLTFAQVKVELSGFQLLNIQLLL